MDEDNKLVLLTKYVIDAFQEQNLSRFESLFILEAVKSSLQEQVIKEIVDDSIKESKSSRGPGIG